MPINAVAQSFSTLYSFTGGSDGAKPVAGMIADAKGNLYGITAQGGGSSACNNGCGTIYQIEPPRTGQTQWRESVIHAFSGSDGSGFDTGLLLLHRGSLYGTARNGGASGFGLVFSLTPPAAGTT